MLKRVLASVALMRVLILFSFAFDKGDVDMIFIGRCVAHRYLSKEANHRQSPAEHTSAAFSSFPPYIQYLESKWK
jgi:hypothetical protein